MAILLASGTAPKQTLSPMAQLKKIYFLGRKDPDTGYNYFLDLVKKGEWEIIDNLESAEYVFVGGYLSALENFLQKKIVLASFDNPVKKDYWEMHPMHKYIGLNGQIPKDYSEEAYIWAKAQTWEKLAQEYEQLWQQ